MSVVYTSSSGILTLHFHRYRTLAFAVAAIGNYTGVSFWPYLSQAMLSHIGYSKTMGLIAISQVTHVIAGVLFFHPSDHHQPTDSGKNNNTSRKIEQIN